MQAVFFQMLMQKTAPEQIGDGRAEKRQGELFIIGRHGCIFNDERPETDEKDGNSEKEKEIQLLHGCKELLQKWEHEQQTEIHIQIPISSCGVLFINKKEETLDTQGGNLSGDKAVDFINKGKDNQRQSRTQNAGKCLSNIILLG